MTHDDTDGGVPALRTTGLGKRYGRHLWGLRDCSLTIPPSAVVGLVGPNGAGKTTLLEMIIGLLKPTEGQIEVFGHTALANSADSLARVGYVAQNHPLYPEFTVADMFRLGQAMNPNWDMGLAGGRMAALDLPLKRKIKTLSGGQQAQVSLAMALAKRAPLLVLDEPVASLDPVARLEFMREVMAQVADGGPTVIIASHVVGELERICDWLVVLTHGHVQLAGPVDELLDAHRLLTVPRATSDADLPGTPIHRADSDRHSSVVLRTGQVPAPGPSHPDWLAAAVSFEQLVLAYLQRPTRAPEIPSPAREAEPPGPTTKVMSR
jgi:ABC-2 type transport system ATP-binding protein